MTIRILLVDDHSVVRKGLRTFLSYDPELEVVGEAADGAEALSLAKELKPDVIVMDLLMAVMDGIAAIAAIRRELPETEVLALTSVLEDASVVGAVRACGCHRLSVERHAGRRVMPGDQSGSSWTGPVDAQSRSAADAGSEYPRESRGAHRTRDRRAAAAGPGAIQQANCPQPAQYRADH